jgi:hypothetical protein
MNNDQQFGELIGTVNSIKENTDKIPDIAVRLAEHELRLTAIEPMVRSHEKIAQRSMAVAAIAGSLTGLMSWMFRGNTH